MKKAAPAVPPFLLRPHPGFVFWLFNAIMPAQTEEEVLDLGRFFQDADCHEFC